MKTTLTLLAAVLFFASCKKESTPEPTTPNSPAMPDNYSIVDGGNYNNQMTTYDTALAGNWWVSSQVTYIHGESTNSTPMFSLFFNGQGTGTYYINSSSPNQVQQTTIADVTGQPDITVTVTRYDTVGGIIQGSYSGTLWNDSIAVSGAFKVTRTPDM